MSSISEYPVTDLFSGMGGFSLGFRNAGFRITEGIDNWDDALQSYSLNLHEKATKQDIANFFPLFHETKMLIIGGSPCGDFAKINLNANPYSKRAQLALDYVRIVYEGQPDIFVYENVPTLHQWVRSALMHIKGYKVTMNRVNSLPYGVPSDRDRLIFIGYKKFKIHMPTLANYFYKPVTVREAFSQIKENWGFIKHKPETIAKFSQIPVSSWGNINRVDGKFKATMRLAWDEPAHIVIANVKKLQPLHPSENRVISLAEASALQSFPPDFIPFGTDTSKAQQIANAVPPKMAEGIARVIAKVLT